MGSPRPTTARLELLLSLGGSLVLGLFLLRHPLTLPLRLLAVGCHEAGHALAAWLVGGEVLQLGLRLDESGHTLAALPPGWLPKIVFGSGGYVGTALFGALGLTLSARRAPAWLPRLSLVGAGALLGALALATARDPLTMALLGVGAAALIGAGRLAPPAAARIAGTFLSTFVGLYALFDLRWDLLRLPWEQAPAGPHDAEILAGSTGIPATFWSLSWSALATAVLAFAWFRALDRVTSAPQRSANVDKLIRDQ